MLADLFEVKHTGGKGKGLFAKTFIPKGTIVCFECNECRVLTASEIGYDRMSEKEKIELFDYAYRKKNGSFIAPCGDVRYFNHSCNANVLGAESGFDIAVRDIHSGEEVTYDYRDFYDECRMPCRCGEENCCKVVTFEHPVPSMLQRFWKEKTDSALALVHRVEQPLKEALKDHKIKLL